MAAENGYVTQTVTAAAEMQCFHTYVYAIFNQVYKSVGKNYKIQEKVVDFYELQRRIPETPRSVEG